MSDSSPQFDSRRRFLQSAGGGAGMLACSLLDAQHSAKAGMDQSGSRSQFASHRRPLAKRVIWLFMHGGPSHVDLFDPKPALTKYSGQPLPESFGPVMTRRDVARNPLLAPVRRFRPRGSCGIEISDFLPEIADLADDLCVVRSLHGDSVNHPQSVYQMNTGSILTGHPSVGSWVAYGLGSENQNMPAFVVLPDPGGGVKGGPPAWGSGYLSASFQGVTMRPGVSPVLNLSRSGGASSGQQQVDLNFIQAMNRQHLAERDNDDQLGARIRSYELAFRMQSEAPDLVDIGGETADVLKLYGIDQPETREFGQRCLLARRMIERGVRFVQLYSGDTNGWDAHDNVDKNHSLQCRRTDRPVAGLLRDLKQRGLLEDTLVIWGGEFGRMPMSEQGQGRDHNPWGYSVWLAGAGTRSGYVHGATDEIGLRAEIDRVSIHDFHATLLHLLGVDHETLTYFHNGLDERLTGPAKSNIVHDLIG